MYNVRMTVRFRWDPDKDRQNQKKHGVSFDEASSIFRNLVLLVVHCENQVGTEIRIISARKATRNERRTLFGGTTQ